MLKNKKYYNKRLYTPKHYYTSGCPPKKCCRCYNYEHACVCYKQTHPLACKKRKSDTCFCHDYPGHFASVCYANPCDPKNNCCNEQNFKCRSYQNNHKYNCCPSEKANPYYVRGKCGPGLVAYNTYLYYHHEQHKDDCDIINCTKYYRHRCNHKCNCIRICCTDCKSYFHCKPGKPKKCPNCHKVEPDNCCLCNKTYIPHKKYNYCCPICYYKNQTCIVAPPSYKYWDYHN